MTTKSHDPLCPVETHGLLWSDCFCDLIAKVRADERKRIAAGLWPLVEPITSWIAGVNR